MKTNLNPFPHIDTSAADDSWKHCGKRQNCSKQAISAFATMFQLFSVIIPSFIEIYNIFYKLSAADLLYVGKGLIIYSVWSGSAKYIQEPSVKQFPSGSLIIVAQVL